MAGFILHHLFLLQWKKTTITCIVHYSALHCHQEFFQVLTALFHNKGDQRPGICSVAQQLQPNKTFEAGGNSSCWLCIKFTRPKIGFFLTDFPWPSTQPSIHSTFSLAGQRAKLWLFFHDPVENHLFATQEVDANDRLGSSSMLRNVVEHHGPKYPPIIPRDQYYEPCVSLGHPPF